MWLFRILCLELCAYLTIHNSFLNVFAAREGLENYIFCSSSACFNSLMTGMSSGGQFCSHGFWDVASLILKQDTIVKCYVSSKIPVLYDVHWYLISMFWPSHENGSLDCVCMIEPCSVVFCLWQSLTWLYQRGSSLWVSEQTLETLCHQDRCL